MSRREAAGRQKRSRGAGSQPLGVGDGRSRPSAPAALAFTRQRKRHPAPAKHSARGQCGARHSLRGTRLSASGASVFGRKPAIRSNGVGVMPELEHRRRQPTSPRASACSPGVLSASKEHQAVAACCDLVNRAPPTPVRRNGSVVLGGAARTLTPCRCLSAGQGLVQARFLGRCEGHRVVLREAVARAVVPVG